MPRRKPADRHVLATAVVDSLVVAADPDARRASIVYWEQGRRWTGAVVEAVTTSQDPAIRSLGWSLLDEPADRARYADLRSALLDRDDEQPSIAAIFDLAWQAECNSRVGYHLGPLHDPDALPVSAEELLEFSADAPRGFAPGSPSGGCPDADVLVVVPFRDNMGGMRLRNLLACLLGLRDQSLPRERYHVTVVESDEAARWEHTVTPVADHYLFAAKPGDFNKSWAVNVGVVNTPGEAELICILDADVLVDRDFLARNAARFGSPGAGGHLTYRNMLCLDSAATSGAIRQRLHSRATAADTERLRGFLLRRPPGCCVWVRSGPFHRIGGMDERYEGWGGEDYDFAHRFDLAAPFDAYDDPLLHMYHPPSSLLTDEGEQVNAHIPALSWQPGGPIGRLDRFAAAGDSVAGS